MTAESLKEVTPVFAVSDPEFAILSREGVEIFHQRVEGYRKPDLTSRREGGVWDAYMVFTEQTTVAAP